MGKWLSGRLSLYESAVRAAAGGGGPPLPLPSSLTDMGPILARWPLMLKYDEASGELWLRYVVETATESHLDRRAYVATKRGPASNYVRIDGIRAQAARVVWLLHHGAWPIGRIGRKDGDEFNDRIENLFDYGTPITAGRPAKRPVGVSRLRDRWQAYVDFPDGSRKWLGRRHLTEADAVAARRRWDEGLDLV